MKLTTGISWSPGGAKGSTKPTRAYHHALVVCVHLRDVRMIERELRKKKEGRER
jgi:hypothetical protein